MTILIIRVRWRVREGEQERGEGGRERVSEGSRGWARERGEGGRE